MTSSVWLVCGNRSTGTAYLGVKGADLSLLLAMPRVEPSLTKFSIAKPSGLQLMYTSLLMASHCRIPLMTSGSAKNIL